MKGIFPSVLRVFGALAVLSVLWPSPAQGQFVSPPPCPPLCAAPDVIQNAVFQNIYVFVPTTPGETWDQHMAAFLQNSPSFGPPAPGSSFVNCMDGTSSPCLQGLTTEAIDNFVQALVNSNYFQAMENSYGVGPPLFAGEQALIPSCLAILPSGSADYWHLAAFASCQAANTPNSPLQFNLIMAPDLVPPTEIDGTQLCGSGDKFSFHVFAQSGINISNYLTQPPFENGLQQCLANYVNPAGGLFDTTQNCLVQNVANQCWAAALGGAVFCPGFDFFFPGLCETLDFTYVAGCLTEAGVGVTEQVALANKISLTVIPTNPVCLTPSIVGIRPRQILGGAKGGATTGGVVNALDQTAVALSHEMAEAITDPAGLGWVHPNVSSLSNQYDTGEIADICEPNGLKNNAPSLTSTAFMPFLFLHVARYWSNADNQCMPQFDAANGFHYLWLDANTIPRVPSQPGNSVVAMVAGATPVSGGFWGNALSSPQTNQPNIRVTDLGTTAGPPWDTTISPPQQFGNSIDLGGSEGTLSFLPLGTPFPPQSIQMVAASPDDALAVELWDTVTGQGCTLCQWPPPSPTCILALQQQPPPAGSGACTANFNAETLTYGLSQSPLDGNVTYTLSPATAGTVSSPACNAITPCPLSITFPNGSGSYTLVANDAITPPAVMSLFGLPANFPAVISCSVTFPVNPSTTGSNACGPSGTNPGSASFTLKVAVQGCGTVTSTAGTYVSGARSCANGRHAVSSTCNAVYSGGTVTLTATPSSGSFLGWGGSCSGLAPTCTVPMDQNQNVTAKFSLCPGGTTCGE